MPKNNNKEIQELKRMVEQLQREREKDKLLIEKLQKDNTLLENNIERIKLRVSGRVPVSVVKGANDVITKQRLGLIRKSHQQGFITAQGQLVAKLLSPLFPDDHYDDTLYHAEILNHDNEAIGATLLKGGDPKYRKDYAERDIKEQLGDKAGDVVNGFMNSVNMNVGKNWGQFCEVGREENLYNKLIGRVAAVVKKQRKRENK